MAEVALAGLRLAISPILNKLLANASTYLGVNMANELHELETSIMPQFNLVIEAAETSPHRRNLEAWLGQLKEALYTAEDLLDEHEYSVLRHKPKNGNDDRSPAGLNELKSTLAKAKDFRQLLGLPALGCIRDVATAAVPLTTSLPPPKVFGRDSDRNHIIDLLTNKDNSAGYSGVAIVAHGGAGKSTLAQYVYSNDRVKKHFDVRMWCKLSDMLQQSEKFLLVLDDVWFQESADEIEWQQLLAPLVSQRVGSKVLVTSRRDTFPVALCCKHVVHLEILEDTEFLKLFKYHSFSGAEIRDEHLRAELDGIAVKIAKQLGQSPLAAQVLGSQLSRNKDLTTWKDALKLKRAQESSIVDLFPKGHKYSVDELLYLWIAEGLVDSRNQDKRMDDIGRDYINEMVSCSFFQTSESLYEELSREDCFRLEDDNVTEIPCAIRHLSVRVESMKKRKQSICKIQNLRTVICIDPLVDNVSDIFHEVLQNLKKLRVLYLCSYDGRKLPQSVADLKHLRYLNLIRTSISELPGSLSTLYHLQILLFNFKVKSLPDKICNLSNLQHLGAYLDEYYGYPVEEGAPPIPYMGKLISLQGLQKFSVLRLKGYGLGQLRDINNLGGILSITNLENATGKVEALESKLHQKRHLEGLRLNWSFDNDLHGEDSSHLDVFEGLMPPPGLKFLLIWGYKSSAYPSWLLDGKQMKTDNLASRLALIWELDSESSSRIKKTILEEHSYLKQMMPLMDTDVAEHLRVIESSLAGGRDEAFVKENIIKAWIHCQEQRIKLLYRNSLGTQFVPPSTLCELRLCNCSITDWALTICLGGLSSLNRLQLQGIMSLTTLPSEAVFQHLKTLHSLVILECWCIRSLGGINGAASILSVNLSSCPSLGLAHGVESMPLSLEELDVSNCMLASETVYDCKSSVRGWSSYLHEDTRTKSFARFVHA
ncbi:unnamed protein product [Miscanthus lutarioriparius]|uniref:Uncharacterized protein n=1 Tax=Miscanthus lutarioriparius TaxID=422564 RepID=A0A811RCN6_9POAL|nr:unnamed protein product [Miscanthus lutarioriparius]